MKNCVIFESHPGVNPNNSHATAVLQISSSSSKSLFQSESTNKWLLWKSFLLNGENWLHFLWCASFLTFLELPCDLHLSCFVLTSSDTAKLYDVEWTMSDPWPSDFTAGSFLGSPQKQTITNVLPPNKFRLTQPKDLEIKVQTSFSY